MSDGAITPGMLIGPYRVGGLLGRGGMAVVYEATHESIGRTVALKLVSGEIALDDAFVERFRREGRVHAALEHPNVVAVYEAGRWEHGLYLAMQLVGGPTLAALIDRGALTVQRTLTLFRQVAEALDAVHAAGLVHRDVKPRNVLVGPGDHAYLADYGLAKRWDASALTITGHMLGTVAYLSPEVIKGMRATGASDRYAFAAMLFECLSGAVVFPRPTHAAMLYAHTTEPPPQISARRPELPPRLMAFSSAPLLRTHRAGRRRRRHSSRRSKGSCASTRRSISGRRRRWSGEAATRTRRPGQPSPRRRRQVRA